MRNRIIPFGMFAFILACSSPKIHIPGTYEARPIYFGEEQANATKYTIKEAGKKAAEHPDEDILNNEIKITLNFTRNEKYDTAAFDKLTEKAKKSTAKKEQKEKEKQEEFRKSLDKIMKGDYSGVTIDNKDKDEEMTENPIPDGEVYTVTKYEYEYTTLKDFINKPFFVSYTSMTEAKNFTIKIDDKTTDLEQQSVDDNDDDYFKNDSRYIYYDMSLPIRGTRVNAKYFEKCRDAKFKSAIYIPEENFTEKKIIKIAKPDWLEFDVVEMNFQGLDYKKEEIEEYDNSVEEQAAAEAEEKEKKNE